jgi:UDPglucose 6-dehydrogenase
VGPKAMLSPGLGVAGGTLARDMQSRRSLGDPSGLETPLLDGAWESNGRQNQLVVRKLKKAFDGRGLSGVRAAVLGLTYKPDTSTLRRSASLEIIGDMAGEGMIIAAHDPKADREELAERRDFQFAEDVYEAVEGADALVLITPWPEYKSLDFARVRRLMSRPMVIDTANLLDARSMERLGFTYLDIGRGRVA